MNLASRSLDSLPFDVFFQIATLLDDRDCVNLSRTNKILHESMKNELIAKKTVEVSLIVRALEGRGTSHSSGQG